METTKDDLLLLWKKYQNAQNDWMTALLGVIVNDESKNVNADRLPESPPTKEWMNQKEACKWIGISPGTLYKWRTMGLKVAVIDGKTLVSREELTRFIQTHEF